METTPDPAASQPLPLAFGPFVLDLSEARLLNDGAPVALVGRPLQVLDVLARRAGRLVGKDELLDAVWGHRHVTESVLKVALNALRSALGDDARRPRYVETVPRRGFRFIAPVAEVGRHSGLTTPVIATSAPARLEDGAAGRPRAGNLPPPRPGLVGRHADHEQLLRLLHDHRLVTLTGLAGMGKTRLALDVGAHEAPSDGAWLLRLDSLPPADDGPDARAVLVGALAGVLPVPPAASDGLPALAAALAPLALRLVLDNAEHVAAPLAAVLTELLTAAPRLRVLVTSQHALRLADEQVMPLAPLALAPPPRPGDPPHAHRPDEYAAGRLLVGRIARSSPGWAPRPEDHDDIAAICRMLDGVPLAIELAAARVPLLGLAGVRARLVEPLALLTRGASDSAARHRTLLAALQWTFSLLDGPQQQALQQLAVFVGGFTAEAAEQVLKPTAGAVALDLLQDLLDRSLVVADPDGERLRLYESVRQHALQALVEAGREPAARLRHQAWALAQALALEDDEFRRPQLVWLPKARNEVANLRAALRFGLDEAADTECRATASRIAIALAMPWVRLGLQDEVTEWLQRLRSGDGAGRGLSRSSTLAAELDRAWATLSPHVVSIDARAALGALQSVSEPLAGIGPAQREFLAHYAQAVLHRRLGEAARVQAATEAALACVQPGWTVLQLRHVRLLQAVIERDEGRVDRYAQQAGTLADELLAAGARAESWPGRNALGQALLARGDLDAGWTLLRALADDIADAGCLQAQWAVLAIAASAGLWRAADTEALELARQAVRLLQGQRLVWWMADALPWAAWHRGHAGDARRLQAWADALVAARGDRRGPVFGAMRADFERCAGSVSAEAAAGLDESLALQLALGPAPAA